MFEEQIQHVDFLISVLGEFLREFVGENDVEQLTDGNRFCFGLLDRVYHAAASLKPLFICADPETEGRNVELGVGLILRSQVLDNMILQWADDKRYPNDSKEITEDSLNEYNKFCKGMLHDDANRSIIGFAKAVEKNGRISKSKLEELKENFKFGNDKVYALKIYEELGKPQKPQSDFIYDSKAIYEFYSKYDHFNRLSIEYLHQPCEKRKMYSKRGVEYMVKNAVYSLKFLWCDNYNEYTSLALERCNEYHKNNCMYPKNN